MTPEEVAQQLVSWHQGSLRQLHQVIDGHKDYLRGLIHQAQAEIQSLTATGDKSSAHEAEVSRQLDDDAVTEEAAATGPKRKAPATQAGASAAERPTKRRGRPPKHSKQPDINAEAMRVQVAELGQLSEEDPSQQLSASATVVAAHDTEAATADEATSAEAGARRRPARGRAAAATEAAAGASARSTRSRRGAAEPAPVAPVDSTGSGRCRRGKATAAPVALEAIAEGEEQQEQQQQNEADTPAEVLLEIAMDRPVGEVAADGVQQQQHQAQQLQSTQLIVSEDAAISAGAGVSKQHLLPQDITAANAAAAADPTAGSRNIPQQSPDDAKQHSRAGSEQHVDGKHSLEFGGPQCLIAGEEAEAEAALPAEAAQLLPKTPGFSLAPKSSQNMASDTPCFVGQVSRVSQASKQHQQQQAQDSSTAAAAGGCCPEPQAIAECTSSDAADKSCSGLPQSSAGFKAHSLSFGEPLQVPLLEDHQHDDADTAGGIAAAAAAALGQATAVGDSNAAEAAADPTATAPVGWKAFISTIHPDDAPTPAVSRGRLRSQSGAGTSQQHSGPLRSSAAAAAAAASPRADGKQSGGAVHGEATATAAAALAPVSSRRVSRSSMKQLRSPHLQALQSDDDFAADGERLDRAISFTPATNNKPKPARSPRPSLPRSAKRSAAAIAAAAEARSEEVELQQQCQQHHLPRSEVGTQNIEALAGSAESEMQDAAEQFDDLDDDAATLVDDVDVVSDTDMPEAVANSCKYDWSNKQEPAPLGDERCAAAVDRLPDGQQQQQQDDVDADPEVEDIFHEVENQQKIDVTDAQAATTEASSDAGPLAAAGDASAAQPRSATQPPAKAAAAANLSKAADPVAAWLAATAEASAGSAGDKAKQQLEAAKENKAAAAPALSATAAAGAAAGGRGNLVSGIRSFVPSVLKKDVPAPVAAGKVKVKVKALETAEAVRKAEGVKAQERAARQQHKEQQPQGKGRGLAETEPLAGHKPQGTPSGAVAHSKVAAVERAAAGLSGSGGAVRVLAQQSEPEVIHKAADRDAAQKKAEKEAEVAKRAMDRAEREDRMKRAEQKRKEEEQKRRQDLAEKQRLKEERTAAAAAALKVNKAASLKAAANAQAARGAVDKAAETKTKQPLAQADHNNCKTPAAPKAAARAGTAAAAAGDEALTAAAHADSPPLTIKLLEPVSTGNKPKEIMGPPAPVGAKTPAAFKTPAPPVSEQEKRNVEALKSSPFVNTGTKRTPFAQKPDPNSYIISPFRDDDVETPDRSHKPIPDWARSHKLYEALKAQQHTDPDTIFGARQTTCDLADMFADVPSEARQQVQQRHKQRKLGQRTSSADWSQDRLTWQEEVKYKKDMGYL